MLLHVDRRVENQLWFNIYLLSSCNIGHIISLWTEFHGHWRFVFIADMWLNKFVIYYTPLTVLKMLFLLRDYLISDCNILYLFSIRLLLLLQHCSHVTMSECYWDIINWMCWFCLLPLYGNLVCIVMLREMSEKRTCKKSYVNVKSVVILRYRKVIVRAVT